MSDPTEEATPEATASETAVEAEATAPADPWRIPLHCHQCEGTWDVPRRAFRTGGVLRCTACHAPYVVQTMMFRALTDTLEALEARGIAADSDEAKRALDELSREFRPPGKPRPVAGVFG